MAEVSIYSLQRIQHEDFPDPFSYLPFSCVPFPSFFLESRTQTVPAPLVPVLESLLVVQGRSRAAAQTHTALRAPARNETKRRRKQPPHTVRAASKSEYGHSTRSSLSTRRTSAPYTYLSLTATHPLQLRIPDRSRGHLQIAKPKSAFVVPVRFFWFHVRLGYTTPESFKSPLRLEDLPGDEGAESLASALKELKQLKVLKLLLKGNQIGAGPRVSSALGAPLRQGARERAPETAQGRAAPDGVETVALSSSERPCAKQFSERP